MKPRGFFRPESSVRGLQRAHVAAAAVHAHRGDVLADPRAGRLGAGRVSSEREPGVLVAGGLGQVGEPVAGVADHRAEPAGRALLAELAAAAEGVGLVEEDDHAAVAEREFAELAEERLHLQDADAHEHVDERARVDEHVRPAGLARDGLGHQGLAGAGRAPEQEAARHVAAARLDRVGLLEEDDVLLDPLDHVVLAPDVGEPRLDVVREVRLDPAAGHEPEDAEDLHDAEQQAEGQLQGERRGLQQQRGSLEDRDDRRLVDDLADHEGDHGDPDQQLDRPGQPIAGPVAEPAVCPALPAAEDPRGEELVVAGRALADQEVDLAEDLEPAQPEEPARVHGGQQRRVGNRDVPGERGHLVPQEDAEGQHEQQKELQPIPWGQAFARRAVAVLGAGPGGPQPLRVKCRRGCRFHTWVSFTRWRAGP